MSRADDYADVLEGLKKSEPGTVGAFLDAPAGSSARFRLGVGALLLAAFLVVLGCLMWLFEGRLTLDFSVFSGRSLDLTFLMPPLFVSAAVVATVGAALVALDLAKGKGRSYDRRGGAKRALLAQMVKVPRFGVSRQSMLAEVGLRSYAGRGCVTFTCRGGFREQDLQGFTAASAGAVDYVLDDGKLRVFFTDAAKCRYVRDKVMR